jgi:predicted phosphodiesterase
MRLCVFGDVHGNADALRAVLAAMRAEGPDLYACTGDVVFGWGGPDACVDAIGQLGCAAWVTGNADQTVLGARGYRLAADAPLAPRAAWDRDRLGAERLRALAARPAGAALHFRDLGTVWLAHGCPPARIEPGVRPAGLAEWREHVADDDAVLAWLRGEPASGGAPPGLFLCGHTHVPTVRRIGQTLVVNPGSVGYGIHHAAPARYQTGNAVARYAVVDWTPRAGWAAAVRRVPYDTQAAVRALEGLPWADAAEVERRRAFVGEPPAADGPADPVQG